MTHADHLSATANGAPRRASVTYYYVGFATRAGTD
jgi:hypothetical protein